MTIRPSSTSHSLFGRPVRSEASHPNTMSAASVDIDSLMPAFEHLVAETLAQVEACPPKRDATFDGYEGLLAAIRSATTLEGFLLEKAIALVAATNPDLVLVPLERPLPVHEAAKAVFRRNDWSKTSGLRLDSEVATREFYKPDLLIVDGARHLALVIDVKRSVSSYKARTLSELRLRMMASALVVRDVLERDHDAPPVARADIAIIDGAGDCRDEAKGIFAIADLDWMLGIDGAANAITRLRDLYGTRVRVLLDERCRAIVIPRLTEDSAHDRAQTVLSPKVTRTDGCHRETPFIEAVSCEVDPLDEADVDVATASVRARRVLPRVEVGIASRRAH